MPGVNKVVNAAQSRPDDRAGSGGALLRAERLGYSKSLPFTHDCCPARSPAMESLGRLLAIGAYTAIGLVSSLAVAAETPAHQCNRPGRLCWPGAADLRRALLSMPWPRQAGSRAPARPPRQGFSRGRLGRLVQAGQADQSELIRRVTASDETERMPPVGAKQQAAWRRADRHAQGLDQLRRQLARAASPAGRIIGLFSRLNGRRCRS